MWLCPECSAQHHATCAEELERCGACAGGGAQASPPEVASAATSDPLPATPEPRSKSAAGAGEDEVNSGIWESGDPLHAEEAALRELEALGFAWEPTSRRAFHPAWSYGPMAGPAELVVALTRREGELTWVQICADAERLSEERVVVGLYLVDQLDGAARYNLSQGVVPWPYVPIVRIRAPKETFYPRQIQTLRPGRILLQPGLRYLARRLLSPAIERSRTHERLRGDELLRLFAPLLGALVILLAASIGLAGLSESAAPYLAFGLIGLGICLRWAFRARQALTR